MTGTLARRPRARSTGLAAGALVVAVGTGAATVLVHRDPGLLALGAAATVTALAVLPRGAAALAYAVGWVSPLVVATVPRTGGGILVELDARGIALLVLGAVVVATGLVRTRPTPPGRPLDGVRGPR